MQGQGPWGTNCQEVFLLGSPNTGLVPESLGPAKCTEQAPLGLVPLLERVYLSCKRRAWIPGLGSHLDILELTEKLGPGLLFFGALSVP